MSDMTENTESTETSTLAGSFPNPTVITNPTTQPLVFGFDELEGVHTAATVDDPDNVIGTGSTDMAAADAARAYLVAQARGDGDTDPEPERPRFVAGYQQGEARVFRERLRVQPDGTAMVRFRGQVANATACWVERGVTRPSLYAEVTPDDTTLTEVRVAVVPTGKRVPVFGTAHRLGSVDQGGGQRLHVYLIGVDGTADRAAYDAERAARRDARRTEREATEATEWAPEGLPESYGALGGF